MKTYYWHSYDDGKAIGAGVRIDAAEGGKKRYFQERLNGKELVESKGKNALPLYIAGAATRDSTPPPEEDMRALWQSYYDADYIFIVEGEKNAEDLYNAVKSYDEKIVVVTQGSSDYAKRWKDDAKELAKGVEEAVDDIKVYVFSDNDEPGRKAAKTTVQAFHDAGFANIFTLDMSLQYDGEEAVETYDISDYLDGGDLKALIAGARRYDPICEKALDAAKAREERRAERARIRAELEVASSMEIDNAIFERLPNSIRNPAQALARAFRKPVFPYIMGEYACLGGYLGWKKAVLEYLANKWYPNVGVLFLGKSGSGKSPSMRALSKPIKELREKPLTEAEKKRLIIQRAAAEKLLHDFYCGGKNVKKTENELVEELQGIERKLTPPIEYLVGYKSAAGVDLRVDKNTNIARERGIVPNGAILYKEDAARIFDCSNGVNKALDELSHLCDLFDGAQGGGGVSVTQKTEQVTNLNNCGFFLGLQPLAGEAITNDKTVDNGFPNRLIYCYLPITSGDRDYDYTAEVEPYYELFDKATKFNGAVFGLDGNAAEVYKHWRETNEKRAESASDVQASYIMKLEYFAGQIALVTHCVKCFESGVIAPKVDAETMETATLLMEPVLESHYACYRTLKTARDNGTVEKRKLSGNASKIYRAIIDAGLSLDLTEEAKEAEIKGLYAVELNDIRSLSCYKDRAKRDAIDKELREAGLMILDGNKRVAIVYEEMQWHD